MKKEYTAPSIVVYRCDMQEILTTSVINGGGSNTGGGPNVAESKIFNQIEDDDNDNEN